MPRKSNAVEMLPSQVKHSLEKLGADLRLARKRRKDSLASFAERMQVSIPTLRKMEQGDPTVSIAVYAMAMWLIGRVQFLGEIANPASDDMALMMEMRNLTSKGGKWGG